MYISIDFGGTTTRVASSVDLTNITRMVKFPTCPTLPEQQQMIKDSIREVAGSVEAKVCLGVPGFLDHKNRIYKNIVNFHPLTGLYYDELFDNSLEIKALEVENDASLAGLAEATIGNGKNYRNVAYITLSTGVGGVQILNKKLHKGQIFSEPGHIIIKEGGRYFESCGQNGCFSAYCSATAFKQIYNQNPTLCRDVEIWDAYSRNLATGLISVISVWAPEIIILGGIMSTMFENYYKEPLLKHLSKQKLFEIPEITTTHLKDDAGVYGGFEYLKQLNF